MVHAYESTFILQIRACCKDLHDWSGYCAQLASPLVQTCFTCTFSVVKSYPFTNYMQLCRSENVTQGFSLRVLPSFPLWPEVHGNHPHRSLNPISIQSLNLAEPSCATFSAERNSLNSTGEAQCISSYRHKNLLLAHLRTGDVSLSWKEFRAMYLLEVI